MTAPATTILESLKTHLAGITAANGYSITVASVSTGRSALAVNTTGPFPAILLTPYQDQTDNAQPQGWLQSWNRVVYLEGLIQETTDWMAELDTVWDAIRHRLARWNGLITSWGPVDFTGPEDGGGLCSVRLPLTLSYNLNISES